MNKIMEDTNINANIKANKRINDYFLKITNPSKEDLFIIKTYNFLFKNQNQSDNNNNLPYRTNVVTLGKYEIFMILEPGAFFGEMALENESYRRNATIRVEENCFIASLSNELYNAIFLEENKKLKIKDVNFICNNFFFKEISPVIFNKYYYPMLKLINKEKNDCIYLQDTKISSIFLLKEGSIKYEICASIFEINQLIKKLIESLIKNRKNFKIENKLLNNLRKEYLLNKKMFNVRNQNYIMSEELRKKYKYEISSCEEYETMGILEFFIKMNCIHSCYANSPQVKLLEINRDSLEKILNLEKDIVTSYYTLVYSKIISTIKRLGSIEKNFINQIEDKINSNFYSEKNLNNSDNNEFKKDIQSLPPNYDNYGFCEKSILIDRKKFYSPIKFSKIKKNYFIKEENMKSKDNLLNFMNPDNRKYIIKNLNLNKPNIFDTNKLIKKSLSFGNDFSIKVKNKDLSDRNKDTFINIGKSSLSLKTLKHQILLNNGAKMENLSNLKNSINSIRDSYEANIDNKMDFNFNQNILLKRLNKNYIKLKDKKQKYNINIYLQENKIQNEESFPVITSGRKIPQKNKPNMNKIKSCFYDINNSLPEFFGEDNNKNENALSKYIKQYFNDKKHSGYIGLVNIENNRYIKKK